MPRSQSISELKEEPRHYSKVPSTTGRTVMTTAGTHVTGSADGPNANEYPFSVPTCTAALADVATGCLMSYLVSPLEKD
jgi:hypothetical protein